MRTDSASSTRDPQRIVGTAASTDELIVVAFARIDAVALGCAVGTLSALLVFAATIILLIKGGQSVGPRLALLAQYFIGYTVTLPGSFVGLLYGFGLGFGVGWLLASLRNLCLSAYLQTIRLRSQLSAIHDMLDPE